MSARTTHVMAADVRVERRTRATLVGPARCLVWVGTVGNLLQASDVGHAVDGFNTPRLGRFLKGSI